MLAIPRAMISRTSQRTVRRRWDSLRARAPVPPAGNGATLALVAWIGATVCGVLVEPAVLVEPCGGGATPADGCAAARPGSGVVWGSELGAGPGAGVTVANG